jgi:hypothetical protein
MKLIDIFQKLDESSVNEVHSHDDDYEDCDACNGTGEGRWEGETCHACHGSGVQKPEHDDDDFDIPDDDDFDGGDEESYYEKSLRSRGLEEGTSNVGNAIKSLCQKIYAAGDDEFEYFYHDSPVFAQYWDEYEGDLDSIIAEVDPAELQVMLDEIESYVQQANLAEGDVAKLAGITALGIGAGLGANYLDQQQPRVEFDGKNGQVVRAYLEPGYSNRIPDNAMVIKGKDGKTYHVWSSSGKGMNSKSYHAAPVEPVKEGADDRKQNALWAQITAHEKAAKKSKDLKQQHHLKMADQLRSQLKTSDNVEEGLTKLPNGNYRNMHTGVQQSKPPVKKKRGEKTGAEWDAIEKAKKDKELKEAPIELDPSEPTNPMIYGHEKANPAKLDYRMLRAAGQFKDLASRVRTAQEVGDIRLWSSIIADFKELSMNVGQISHALEELEKTRRKGGVNSRGIPDLS